jgi:RecB family exonuclease
LETQRLTQLLREWLPLERQRLPFRVVARETSASVQLAGLELALRVDRIDQLEDGSSVIIDYKSGAAAVADWLGSRPAKPQLPLYGLAADGPLTGLAFATVRERACQFSGLARAEVGPGIHTDIETQTRRRMPSPDWPALLTAWQQVMEGLAAAFAGGEAAVDPLSASSCSHCGLQALCRVEQRRAASSDEAGA